MCVCVFLWGGYGGGYERGGVCRVGLAADVGESVL